MTSSAVMPPCLEVLWPDRPAQRIALGRINRLLIGRMGPVDLRLDDPTVSRQHAELFQDPFGRWWLRDLGSRNGTYVNGRRIDETMLASSDHIHIGALPLRLVLETGPPSPPVEPPPRQPRAIAEATEAQVQTLADFPPPAISADEIVRIVDLGAELLKEPTRRDRLSALCRLMVNDTFNAAEAMVLGIDLADPSPSTAAVLARAHRSDRGGAEEDPPRLSQRVLGAVAQQRRAVMASNLPRAGGEVGLSSTGLAVGVLACPLQVTPTMPEKQPHREDDWAGGTPGGGRTPGETPVETTGKTSGETSGGGGGGLEVLYVVVEPHYATAAWLALTELAVRQLQLTEASLSAIERRRHYEQIEHDLIRARTLQKALLPRSPRHTGLELAIGFEPCRWVGGDMVDVLRLSDDRVLLLIADVCGKGLDAAMIASSLRSATHTTLRAIADPASLAALINDHMCELLTDQRFVTLLMAAIDPGDGQVQLVNAGHLPPLTGDSEGRVRTGELAANLPMGLESMTFTSQHETLAPGETMMLCTDGLTELCDPGGSMLRYDGLADMFARILRESGRGSLTAVADSLRQQLRNYGGRRLWEDDMTFLLARRA